MRSARYLRYASSRITWINHLPEGWKEKPLKRIFSILNGSTPKSSIDEYWDGDINWFTPDDLGSNLTKIIYESRRKITDEGYANCGVKIAPAFSIVLSTRAPIGHLALIGNPGCVNQGCRLLVCNSGNSSYWYYLLFAAKQELISFGQGSTFYELSRTKLARIILPFPTFDEQDIIAEFLDYKTQQIDDLINKREHLLELLEEKRIALITKAVTKGLDRNVKLKPSGIDWLGEIPEHWEVKRLKFIANCNQDSLPEDTDPQYLIEYVEISGVDRLKGIIATVSLYFHEAPSRARRKVKKGDTIVSTVRTYLKAIAQIKNYQENLIVSTGFAVVEPKHKITRDYLSYYLQNEVFINTVVANSVGVSYPAINASDLMNIIALRPPLEEQDVISKYLDKELKKLDDLSSNIQIAIDRLKEYRTALITEAVTGKIDVRDFNPEKLEGE